MSFYNGSVNYNRQQQPTLWQQAMLSKEQEQELYNFLSIGCGGRCRERSKQLNLALQKKRQINIVRKRVIKIMRSIGLDKGFAKKIVLMLEKSGLSLDEQKSVARSIKRLLLDFNMGLHNMLDLRGLQLSKLPLSLRRFIIALIVLKAEIANLYRLRMEALDRLIKRNNEPTLSNNDRNIALNMDLDIDNHKHYSNGISLTKGNWDGTRGMYTARDSGRNINFENKTTKRNRNYEENKQRNSEKYYCENRQCNEKESKIDKDDFYKNKTNSRNYYSNSFN